MGRETEREGEEWMEGERGEEERGREKSSGRTYEKIIDANKFLDKQKVHALEEEY